MSKSSNSTWTKLPQSINLPKGELVIDLQIITYRKRWWHWWKTKELYALTEKGLYRIQEKL